MADYSTHARVVLSNSETLSNYIRKYSLTPAEARAAAGSDDLSSLILLTSKQIDEAIHNPQNSLKVCIQSYVTIIATHRHIITVQHQAYQQQLAIEQGIQAIRERYPKVDPSQKETLVQAMKTLEQYYKEIAAMHKQLSEFENKLLSYEQQLSEMIEQIDIEWDDYRSKFLEELIQNLIASDIPLTELEQTELKTQDAWAAILKRFKDLSLPVPSYIKLDKPNFQTYFELKSFLAIHASLGRRMLPHSAEDIAKL